MFQKNTFTGMFIFVLLLSSLLTSLSYAQQVQTFIREKLEINANTTSQMVLDINLKRRYFLLQNKGNLPVYVAFDDNQTSDQGIKVAAGGNWEPSKAPTNRIYLKTASGTSQVVVIYGQE